MKDLFNVATVSTLCSAIIFLLLSYIVPDHPHFWKVFFHEIGFALLVSFFIWFIFELSRATKSEEEWSKRLESISKAVFLGVYRKKLPDSYIQEVNSLVIDASFLRTDLRLQYVIMDDSYQDRFGANKVFIRLETTASFKVVNTSDKLQKFPIALGMANPIIDEMKAICVVRFIELTQKGLTSRLDLTAADMKFRQAIRDDTQNMVPFDVCTIDLERDEKIELIYCYQYAKEEEDTEIYQTLYPADGISIDIIDRVPGRRAVRAKSIGPHELSNLSAGRGDGLYSYRLSRYVPPWQGIVIWWKKVPVERETP